MRRRCHLHCCRSAHTCASWRVEEDAFEVVRGASWAWRACACASLLQRVHPRVSRSQGELLLLVPRQRLRLRLLLPPLLRRPLLPPLLRRPLLSLLPMLLLLLLLLQVCASSRLAASARAAPASACHPRQRKEGEKGRRGLEEAAAVEEAQEQEEGQIGAPSATLRRARGPPWLRCRRRACAARTRCSRRSRCTCSSCWGEGA